MIHSPSPQDNLSSWKPKLLSVIFSFRNEEDVLPELIQRVRQVIREEKNKGILSGHELIFVNDASTDRSLDILLEHSKNNNDISVINMSRVFGVAPCVLAGMEYSSGDLLVYMDADLQDPPELISSMLKALKDDPNVDVVHSVRRSRTGEPKLKLFITRIGYLILNKFTTVQIPIEAGDFKLLTRRAVNHILRLKENRPFMRGLVCWIGFKQAFVPYDRRARFAGKTKFHVLSKSVINNFFNNALISFTAVPLNIATVFGILAILIDFLLLIHVFLEKIEGKAIPGWTAIMIAVLFLGGVQLFCSGIIGLYINSIHEQGKNRPPFIVTSTYGFNEKLGTAPDFFKNSTLQK